MNFKELFEGATPKLPGAVGGIKVMSMDQFLAQSGDEPEEKIDEMSSEELDKMSPEELAQFTHKARSDKSKIDPKTVDQAYGKSISIMFPDSDKRGKQSTQHKQQNVNEATKLPAQTRELKGQELEDYLDRIRNREKGKTDKYKLPYIHRSSVVKYYNEEGKRYDTDQIKTALGVRPKKLLKQNEKMKHSNGELEQFYNIGFAALVGIALDEGTNELIVVNTCPGAGSCKVDCFAMKGGKIQFKAAWQSDGRILTYLLNDPSGFFNQLSSEISKEEAAGKKGDKKFPNGWQTTIRWHDAGDFFSPEYLDLALKMAAKHPDVKFYAYTKMAGAALAQKPPNFIINWSEGAILKHLRREGIISPNKPTTHNSSLKVANETYAGGYLLEPIPGLYFDVIDLDFTSLYPSIIKSLNLGIETLIGRIRVEHNATYEQNHSLEKLKQRDPNEEVIVEKLNKTNYTLKSAKIKIKTLIDLIEKNEYTIAASGAIFDTNEQSICSTILQGWFEKREHYRALKKKAGKEEDWANYKLYDLFQHAFKILQNAMYGTYAKNGWRYTDGHLICSAAITNSGQRLTMSTIDFVNDKINNEYLQLSKEELIKRFNLA